MDPAWEEVYKLRKNTNILLFQPADLLVIEYTDLVEFLFYVRANTIYQGKFVLTLDVSLTNVVKIQFWFLAGLVKIGSTSFAGYF